MTMDVDKMIQAARDAGIEEPYLVYGIDLATDPDMTKVMILRNGSIIEFGGEEVLDRYRVIPTMPLLLSKDELKDRDRPWVGMKRKPWERR